jgi:DNA polymerase (family 10)
MSTSQATALNAGHPCYEDFFIMDNEAIAQRFRQLADLMELRGEDQFRIRSYRNAADTIETWPTPLQRIAKEDGAKGLQTIPGIGKAISGKIIELFERGTFDAWEKLTAETPATALDLLQVGGIGIKTAATLHQKFKISSLSDLKEFVAGGGLDLVDGIGEKSAERIQESLKRF